MSRGRTTAQPSAPEGRAELIASPVRLLVVALLIGALVVAALIVPSWVPLWPRSLRRAITEVFLGAILVVYSVLLLSALLGTPLLAWLWKRSRSKREVRRGLERGFLAGLSCLFSILLLELGSAAWLAWMHRFPALPATFDPASPEEYRIVVLGGSSALGEPYRPWLSVGQIVAWQLGEKVKGRRFECEILAWLGESLEMQHHRLAGLRHRPDAVIIYSGHNEFAARFEEEREGWLEEEPRTWPLALAYRATLISPFRRLVYEVISKNRLDSPPPLAGRHQLIDPPQCSRAEAARITVDYGLRLEAIVAYCERIGALPIVIVPPANEAGYEPSRSTLPPGVPGQERRRLYEEFTTARAGESQNPQASAHAYEAIIARHPGFAEAHFRLGRLLERTGSLGAAAEHYLRALDHDGLPIRAPAAVRSACALVAERHPRAILIDGRKELMAVSPSGLLDDHVIQDTHHPTLVGYTALAGAVLREMGRRGVFGAAVSFERPLDPAVCAGRFGMDEQKWSMVCDRSREHYKRVAGYRYDPAERLFKSRRYAEARDRLARGTPADKLGVPGLGAQALSPHGLDSPTGGLIHRRFELPVLELDHGAPPEEVDGGDEMVTFSPPHDLAHHPGQGAGRDADGRTHRQIGLRRDGQARGEHGVDVLEVARQRFLIGDLEHAHQPIAAQRHQSIVGITIQEHVSGEERDDGLDLPALRRPGLLHHLGKVVKDAFLAELAGDRLFLAGLGVQAPPDGIVLLAVGIKLVPEARRVTVGLGWQYRHRGTGAEGRRAVDSAAGVSSSFSDVNDSRD
jgi:Tetratricopeptide repeat